MAAAAAVTTTAAATAVEAAAAVVATESVCRVGCRRTARVSVAAAAVAACEYERSRGERTRDQVCFLIRV